MKKLTIPFAFFLSFVSLSLFAGGFAGGSGTHQDPFLVATAHHLNEVREYPDKYFLQIADISLNVAPYNMGNYWIPIGGNRNNNDIENNFTGVYNGNGFVITDLTIVQPGNANVGLFGHIGKGSAEPTTIKNVHLQNVVVIGGNATGALAGRVTGNQNTRIENCSVETGYVRGDAATGGLVGSNNSFMESSVAAEGYRPVIYQSSADVSVLLRSEYSEGKIKFGGLVGCNQKGMISHSYAMGDVTINDSTAAYIGGLTGSIELRGIIINSYSTTGVFASSSSHRGGLTGGIGQGRTEGVVLNSYWNKDNNPDDLNTLGAQGLTTEQMQDADSYHQWDFLNVWQTAADINYGFPSFVEESAIKTQVTWNGSQSSAWENNENWTPAGVPASSARITIPAGTVNMPVIASIVTVNELIIFDDAVLELQSGQAGIIITGNLSGGDESVGTARIIGEGFLELAGNNLQTIPAMVFENLVIKNPNNVQLSGRIVVSGLLKMEEGLLDLRGFEITLGEQAVLQEKEDENMSSRVYGSSGVISTLRNLNNPSGPIAGMGLEITSNKDLGSTLIERGHSEINGTDESKSILRWFNIEPAVNENLDATLVFHYFISELNIYGENDNFSLFKRKHGDTEWIWVPSELDAYSRKLTAENVNEFSTWTAGSSDNPLPIVLLSFDGIALESEVELSWITAAEVNNDFFTVERSIDGVNFEEVATVKGAGTSSQAHFYSTLDTKPLNGLSYYRLKQTDFNGDYEYSKIISVFKDAILAEDIRIYPNPSNGMFNILLGGEKTIEYRIIDMQGRIIFNSLAEPGQISPVNMPHLKQGIYTVAFFADEMITKKIQVY